MTQTEVSQLINKLDEYSKLINQYQQKSIEHSRLAIASMKTGDMEGYEKNMKTADEYLTKAIEYSAKWKNTLHVDQIDVNNNEI